MVLALFAKIRCKGRFFRAVAQMEYGLGSQGILYGGQDLVPCDRGYPHEKPKHGTMLLNLLLEGHYKKGGEGVVLNGYLECVSLNEGIGKLCLFLEDEYSIQGIRLIQGQYLESISPHDCFEIAQGIYLSNTFHNYPLGEGDNSFSFPKGVIPIESFDHDASTYTSVFMENKNEYSKEYCIIQVDGRDSKKVFIDLQGSIKSLESLYIYLLAEHDDEKSEIWGKLMAREEIVEFIKTDGLNAWGNGFVIIESGSKHGTPRIRYNRFKQMEIWSDDLGEYKGLKSRLDKLHIKEATTAEEIVPHLLNYRPNGCHSRQQMQRLLKQGGFELKMEY